MATQEDVDRISALAGQSEDVQELRGYRDELQKIAQTMEAIEGKTTDPETREEAASIRQSAEIEADDIARRARQLDIDQMDPDYERRKAERAKFEAEQQGRQQQEAQEGLKKLGDMFGGFQGGEGGKGGLGGLLGGLRGHQQQEEPEAAEAASAAGAVPATGAEPPAGGAPNAPAPTAAPPSVAARLLTLTAGIMLIGAFVLLAASGALADAFRSNGWSSTAATVFSIARWPDGMVLAVAAITLIFKVAPNRHQPKFSWLVGGTVVATVLWLVFTGLLTLYFAMDKQLGQTYGPLLGLIGLLLWVRLTSTALLQGIAQRRVDRSLQAGVRPGGQASCGP